MVLLYVNLFHLFNAICGLDGLDWWEWDGMVKGHRSSKSIFGAIKGKRYIWDNISSFVTQNFLFGAREIFCHNHEWKKLGLVFFIIGLLLAMLECHSLTDWLSLAMLATHSMTDSLTHCCLVNLIDVTLACELVYVAALDLQLEFGQFFFSADVL